MNYSDEKARIIRNVLVWYLINIFTVNISTFYVVKNYIEVFETLTACKLKCTTIENKLFDNYMKNISP